MYNNNNINIRSILFKVLFFLILGTIILYYYGHKMHEMVDWQSRKTSVATSTTSSVVISHINKTSAATRVVVRSDICNCDIDLMNERSVNRTVKSQCSDKASAAAGSQNIVSYCLFVQEGGPLSPEQPQSYYDGVRANLKMIRQYYKGWSMRLYTVPSAEFNNTLCDLECNNQDFFLCNAENLPGIGNVSAKLYGEMWRFLPIGDATVNIFLSRDLDSMITQREKDAVLQWINSNYTFHAMRDHPAHLTRILGGMWGAKNNLITPSVSSDFRSSMFNFYTDKSKFHKGSDQSFLGTEIYPRIKSNLLVHDSYLCLSYKDSVPFPTQRNKEGLFVATYNLNSTIKKECPKECRPVYGQNWIYC